MHGVGFDTTVMMRSIPLRGFDQQMAGQVTSSTARDSLLTAHNSLLTTTAHHQLLTAYYSLFLVPGKLKSYMDWR